VGTATWGGAHKIGAGEENGDSFLEGFPSLRSCSLRWCRARTVLVEASGVRDGGHHEEGMARVAVDGPIGGPTAGSFTSLPFRPRAPA
jgi:hypothetical protein